MIAKFDCQSCEEKGELDVKTADLLNGDAEELCPCCANVLSQKNGELSINALPT